MAGQRALKQCGTTSGRPFLAEGALGSAGLRRGNGRIPACPLLRAWRFGRLLQGVIHLTLLSSVTPTRKLSEQVHARLLILFFAVCKL